MKLDPALLEILACPNCRADLRVEDAASELVCTGCGYAYPVRDDIPVMLIDEADKPVDKPVDKPDKPDKPGEAADAASEGA